MLPVTPRRDADLEPRTLPVLAALPDRHAGDSQDLPAEEEAEACVVPIPPPEDLLLLVVPDTDAVVLPDNGQRSVLLLSDGDLDLRDPLPVPGRIVQEIVKDLPEERIGIDFQFPDPGRDRDPVLPEPGDVPPDVESLWLPHTDVLVVAGELQLLPDVLR
jgi:hypothetical protein